MSKAIMNKALCLTCLKNGTVIYITQSYKIDGKMKNSIFKEMSLHIGEYHSSLIIDNFIFVDKNNKPIPNDY